MLYQLSYSRLSDTKLRHRRLLCNVGASRKADIFDRSLGGGVNLSNFHHFRMSHQPITAASSSSSPAAYADAKAAVRALVFGQLAGLVVGPTVHALAEHGVLDRLAAAGAEGVDLTDLVREFGANRGYLQVALRLLTDIGWLTRRAEASAQPTHYTLTATGRVAVPLAPAAYAVVVPRLALTFSFPDVLAGTADAATVQAVENLLTEAMGVQLPVAAAGPDEALATEVAAQIRSHLAGLLVGPALVALARAGVLAALSTEPTAFAALPADPTGTRLLLQLLAPLGWLTFSADKTQVALTTDGQYAASIATSYGVTVSYLPTMVVVPELLFGNARLARFDTNGVETLVDRGMNVWGSGGAHTTYFRRIDEIIIELFNAPLNQQPRGICDMGCGDGTLLAHLYEVVRTRTKRGEQLQEHPLVIVGADFNKVARRVTRQTLKAAHIPHSEVIYGDINRPAQLAADLEKLGHDAHEFLHVRSFLDHNRVYAAPTGYVAGTRTAHSSGAFATLGDEVPADVLEENLVRHLRRWAPYTGRFGLLAVELHTLPPDRTAANLPRTPAVAYDGTHGYSDQYLVELPVFLACAKEAGLIADKRYQAQFPPSDLATVSINLFTNAR